MREGGLKAWYAETYKEKINQRRLKYHFSLQTIG